MKRRTLLTSTTAGLVAGAVSASPAESVGLISLVQLLSRPNEIDGKIVMTAGYFALASEGADLYLHREDYEACLLPNSVHLEVSAEQRARWAGLHSAHVAIKARFSSGRGKDIGCGTLSGIETIDRIPGKTLS